MPAGEISMGWIAKSVRSGSVLAPYNNPTWMLREGAGAFVKRRLVDREADLYPGTRISPPSSRCPDRPNRKRYRWWPASSLPRAGPISNVCFESTTEFRPAAGVCTITGRAPRAHSRARIVRRPIGAITTLSCCGATRRESWSTRTDNPSDGASSGDGWICRVLNAAESTGPWPVAWVLRRPGGSLVSSWTDPGAGRVSRASPYMPLWRLSSGAEEAPLRPIPRRTDERWLRGLAQSACLNGKGSGWSTRLVRATCWYAEKSTDPLPLGPVG